MASKNYKYVRPPSPSTLMNRAIKDRDVEDLIWSLIALSSKEIKTEGELKTLSGNHIISLIDMLSKIPKDESDNNNIEDLKLFFGDKKK